MGSSNPDTGAIDQGTSAGEWLVNVDSDVVVPMTTHDVVEALRNERLSEMSLVWRMGMHDWTLLREVPQLRLAAGGPRDSEPPRRNTMPGGFAAVKVPVVPVPSGTVPLGTLSPLATPRPSVPPSSTPRLNPPPKPVREQALAVYERPAASLTFSDSARAEWDGTRLTHQASTPPAAFPSTRPAQLTPMPPKAVALSEAPRSAFPNSLMPITTEARPSDTAPPWGDLSVVLASELRAAQRSSRRMALFAAAGSALAAAAFTLWVMHARGVAVPAQPAEAAATRPMDAPLAVQPAPVAPEPTPSASAPDEPAAAVAVPAPAPVKAAVRAAVPRARAKRAKAATKPSAPLASEPVLDSPEASAPSAAAGAGSAAAEPAEPAEVPAPVPPPEPSPAPEAP